MQPRLTVIKSPQDIDKLTLYLSDKEQIAFDTETTGLTQQDAIIGFSVCASEEEAFYVVTHYWNGTDLVAYDQRGAVEDLLKSLIGKELIGHNALFDCIMINANFKIDLMPSVHTDTMILAHLLNENDLVGLKPIAAKRWGESSTQEEKEMKESIAANGGTLTKDNYELYKADQDLIGKYGAKDALLTYRLFLELVPELYEQNLQDFFYKDESMPLLRSVTYDLNETGISVDINALTTLKKTLEAECLTAKDYIYKEIESKIKDKYPGTTKKNTFNIGSNQQLSWLLFEQYGLEFSTLTDAGKIACKAMGLKLPYFLSAKKSFISECKRREGEIYAQAGHVNGKKVPAKKFKSPWSYTACDKKSLIKYANEYKWIAKLLEYQKKNKILTTYIEGVEDKIKYGIIHPSFLQHGTTSGRYSSRNPNFQNLPRDDKRVKACYTARPGKVFVGADYSQLEPRVFAYISGDKNLLNAFTGDSDFYSVIGMRVYGKSDCTPQKEGSPDAFGVKYKKLRDLAKIIALATVYGASAFQLASTTGKSVEDTAEDIEEYLNQFPGVRNLMKESHEQAKANGRVTNIFGRPRRIPDAKRIKTLYGNAAHDELPYEYKSLLNLSTNHRIQSTGASIVNRAAIAFKNNCKAADLDCKIVCQVHDSIIVECNQEDRENVSILLQDAMENTTILEGIALEAVPKIGRNLSEV